MIANVFGKLYAENILGDINIDGGKPVEEYKEYLQKNEQKYVGFTFDNLKLTSENGEENQ